MTADQITIAITVFNRRDYLFQAIASALDQTVPVRVMVVEDAGPDPGMQDWVKGKFGTRIHYHRNAQRRGLFGNWNACMELCSTPWLSILHDDDYFQPNFVATLCELQRRHPRNGLYFGGFLRVNEAGVPMPDPAPALGEIWEPVRPETLVLHNGLGFPGHLLNLGEAKKLGGFRTSSQYAADWEMWFGLTLHCGAARTNVPVVSVRESMDRRRATSQVIRSGRNHALTNVQRKRNYALLRQTGGNLVFDRRRVLRESPIAVRYLLDYGADQNPRLLAYNTGLLIRSKSPNAWHAIFKGMLRCLGWRFVKKISALWRRFN